MPWRDTPERHGLVTRLLHRGMAAIMLWQFAGMALRLALGRTPPVAFWVGTHRSTGTVLPGMIVLRPASAWVDRGRRPRHARTLLGCAARIGQGALYALMLAVPTLALLRAVGGGRGYVVFGWQVVERTGVRIDWLAVPAGLLHGRLAWVLLGLILGPVSMAVAHRLVWRDGVLQRMAGRATVPAQA